MNGLLSMIGIQAELDYLIGDFPACFGNTSLAIPKDNISSDKQKCKSMSLLSKVLRLWQLLRKMLPNNNLIIV